MTAVGALLEGLDATCRLAVAVGQTVRGGETVIAVLH